MTLLEREPGLEALAAALREAGGGDGRVALVYGEAGIGKTTLVDGFVAEASARGARPVAAGRCAEPHGPVAP
jgi:predicted ATPase